MQPSLNIGAPDLPDLISTKAIKRARKVKGTTDWQVTDSFFPDEWITITEEQYLELIEQEIEHEELNSQAVRITLEPETRG